jgi:hypothetical protein
LRRGSCVRADEVREMDVLRLYSRLHLPLTHMHHAMMAATGSAVMAEPPRADAGPCDGKNLNIALCMHRRCSTPVPLPPLRFQ